MALALVRSLEQSGEQIMLEIDTGTNPLYRVLLGRGVRRDEVFTYLDDVFWQSPWARNERAGQHLDTRVRAAVPTSVTEPRCLLQVVTAKDGNRAAAYSVPRRVLVAPGLGPVDDGLLDMSQSLALTRTPPGGFVPPTMVGVRSAREVFSRPASLDDLLGSLVQAALPLVQQLLSGAGGAAPVPDATGAPGHTGAGDDQLAATLAGLLRAVLGAAGTGGGAAGALAGPHSLTARPLAVERGRFTRPFIFGIDDALLASLAGPILSSIAGPLLEKLPELINSANQYRLDSRNADYQMINQLIAGMDRARLADRIASLAASPSPAPADTGSASVVASADAQPSAADLAALLELLRTATAPVGGVVAPTAIAPVGTTGAAPAPTSTAVTPTPGSTGASVGPSRVLSLSAAVPEHPTASQAVLTAVAAPAVAWLGGRCVVLVRDQAVSLRYRLAVPDGGPTAPLPRAILRLVVRRPGGGPDLLQREQRLSDVLPGADVVVLLDAAALAPVPADTEVEVFAQLRWPTSGGTRQCSHTQTVVFTSGRYVTAAGSAVGARVELTDMTRFRPFWNKVWASPTPTSDKPLWGIDLTLRYSVVVTDQPANGLMEVRTLAGEAGDGLRDTSTGRMRSGLQVAVPELAKLRSLWPGATPAEATIAAFEAPEWRAGQGGDAEVQVRFDGRRHTRGLVWVVPVPTLRSFSVARAQEVDPWGQVISVAIDEVAFPVVEAVRVIGLASTESSGSEEGASELASVPDTGSAYAFEGYRVVSDTLVGLEPARPVPAAPTPPATLPALATAPVGSPR